MPLLTLFAPCEKHLINYDDSTLSLISIIDTVNINVPEGIDVPLDAEAGGRFQIVTQWYYPPEDIGRTFLERVYLLSPTGRKSEDNISELGAEHEVQRSIGLLNGFPVGETGIHFLCVLLKEDTEDAEWQEYGRFPIRVVHQVVPQSTDEDAPMSLSNEDA